MTRRQTLAEYNRAGIERHRERIEKDPIWTIIADEPVERLFVRDGDMSQTDIYGTLLASHIEMRTIPTTTAGVSCIELEPAVENFGTYQSFMKGTMAVFRQSGIHGRYHSRMLDGEKYYEF